MPSLSKLYTRKQIDKIREDLAAKHGDNCAICKKAAVEFTKRLSVDHNHKSNKIRGLLCYRCNRFRVSRQTIETTKEVLEYLLKYDLPEKK